MWTCLGTFNTSPDLDQVDLSQLSTNKQHKLTQLLLKLSSLFPAKSSPLGQISVATHSI